MKTTRRTLPGILLPSALALGLILPLHAQAEVYLGLGAGRADNSTFDDTDTALKAFAGWNFNDTFGVEGGYNDLGEAQLAGTAFRAEAEAINVVGVANLPFTSAFGIFGKAGLNFSEVTVRPAGGRDRDTDLTYGAGVKYDFTDVLGVRGEWERFELGTGETDLLSASLVFRFQ